MQSRRLPDWYDSYIEYTKESEPPPLYHKWVAVSVIASALQRKCYLLWDEPTYPNLYVVLVGPSGCRKGTAMRVGRGMLDEIGATLASESVIREQLINELEQAGGSSPLADGTQISHSSMTIYSPELTVFLGYDKKQLVMDLTDWYDCHDRWRYSTKHSGKNDIKNVFVNLIGATTPALLQSTMTNDAIGGGLTSRMIFAYAAKKGKSIPFPFAIKKNEVLHKSLLDDLTTISLLGGKFKITDAFIERWAPFYQEENIQQIFDDDRFEGYMQRRAKHILKLCMIFSASRSEDMLIDVQDFERALTLLKETEKVMSKAFAGIGKNEMADVMERVMSLVGLEGRIKFSDIVKRFYSDANADEIATIIRTMRAMEFVETKVVGEKSQDYWIIYKEERS